MLWPSYFFLLACCFGLIFGSSNRCDEVRKVFQLRQIGPNQLLPLSPRPGMLLLSLPRQRHVMLFSDLLACLVLFDSHTTPIALFVVYILSKIWAFQPSPPPLTKCNVAFGLSFSGFLIVTVVLTKHTFWTNFRGVCAVMIMTVEEGNFEVLKCYIKQHI